MSIKEFIDNLAAKNLFLVVEDDKLILRAKKKRPAGDNAGKDPEVINYIRANKEALKAYVLSAGSAQPAALHKNITAICKLSPLQAGMLFHGLYDKDAVAYIEQFSCRCGQIDTDMFARSWEILMQRHSILRTGFYIDAFNIPVQCVKEKVALPLYIDDLRELDHAGREKAILARKQADREQPFNFEEAPLMRLSLLRTGEQQWQMLWTYHHMLIDGWSMQLLIQEFLSIYESLQHQQPLPVIAEDRYEDYIRYIERQDKTAEEKFWRSYMSGVEMTTLLPFIEASAERNKKVEAFAIQRLTLNEREAKVLQARAQQLRVTINTVIQGVWALLLHTYTGNEHIVYGVTVSGRPEDLERVEDRIGIYTNLNPLHAVLVRDMATGDWLQQLQCQQLQSREYQHSAINDIQRLAGVAGDWFDSILTFENYPLNEMIASRQWAFRIDAVEKYESTTNYPMSIRVIPGKETDIQFVYKSSLLSEAWVTQICGHFKEVLFTIMEGRADKIGDIRLLGRREQEQLTGSFSRGEQVAVPGNSTILNLFAAQVAATPGKTALSFEGEKISYRELDERSSVLARYLLTVGVYAHDKVPVCMGRSAGFIISLFAILKAGAVYVPIDPAYPAERIAFMLRDTEATVVITDTTTAVTLPTALAKIIPGAVLANVAADMLPPLPEPPQPKQLAYIIYTSGSTGTPKGVMISHSALLHSAYARKHYYGATGTAFLVPSFSFDSSIAVITGTLLSGGQLIICRDEWLKNSNFLETVLPETELLLCVPSYYQFLLEEGLLAGAGLRQVILAGEKLERVLAQKHYDNLPGSVLYNEYGPTEGTVWATVSRIGKDDGPITIGKPIANMELYILDAWGNLQPPGVPGELYIGGNQLAHGYLNQPELTAERFISSPVHPGENKRLYRTHDMVRWLPDGNIEFLGRTDDQVKIRGYRVELGEIEAVLHTAAGVRQAVVLAKTTAQGSQQLLAFVVCSNMFDKEAIRRHLSTVLPDYMIPGIIIPLEAIPLTPNGKTDKKKLLLSGMVRERLHQYTAPSNDTEYALVQIWQSLLGAEKIGVHDDFFELGGHSLTAMRLTAAIRRQWGIDLPIRQVFEQATIARLAPLLQVGAATTLPAISIRPGDMPTPLSFAQERLWFIHHLQGSTQYHLHWVFRLTGRPGIAALQKAFAAVVNRHQVLRTVIREEEGVGYPQLLDAAGWQMDIIQQAGISIETITAATEEWLQQPFDLSNDYMLKVRLTEINKEEYLLAILVHHIAFDGWSVGIMVNELMALYAAAGQPAALPLLPLQYADYAYWQRTSFTDTALARQLAYWSAQLNGVAPLDIHTDYPRPQRQSVRGAQVYRQSDTVFAERIQQLALQEGVTPFMVLMGALNILLYRYSGQEDICIGTPVAGRHYPGLENLAGFFVNTLPLRNHVDGTQTFRQLLQRIKQTAILAYEHQDLPFEKMVDAVGVPRDPARHPIFQVVFSFHNTPPAGALQLDGLHCEALPMQRVTTAFDLNFDVTLTEEALHLNITYCTSLFTENRISRLLDHYTHILEKLIEDPGVAVDAVPLLSPAEESKQLMHLGNAQATRSNTYHRTVTGCFAEQAGHTPDAIALVSGHQQWSYRELDEQSNQVARYLQSIGVKSELPVPIAMERSGLLIVTLLGILKAGGAYVPVDPAYPPGRIAYMLEDIGTSFLLTDKHYPWLTEVAHTAKPIRIDIRGSSIKEQSVAALEVSSTPGSLAYIMYTSGSTGAPKGVMAGHQNIVSLVKQVQYVPLQTGDVLLSTGSPSFDAVTFEYWGMLLNGGRLVMCSHETLLDTAGLSALVREAGVNIMWFTAGWFNQLAESIPALFETLSTIIVGGDRLSVPHIRLLQQRCPSLQIINGYGPTENTTFSLTYPVPADDTATDIPIGRAIDYRNAYVLDQQGRLCPEGVKGELYVGGAGLARGYWKQDELTSSKFMILSSFGRLYKTGDMALRQPDGNILFLGRRDDQVKIRGYRVEPGEIEAVLIKATGVQQAAVVITTDAAGSKYPVAYVVAGNGYEKTKLLQYLQAHLPAYMIPQVTEIQALPLTGNGKVDRKALAALPLSGDEPTDAYAAPVTATETKLAELWQQLLGISRISVHDNFFEKGGHSIMAMRLAGSIHRYLNKELPIRDIFDNPTIAGLALILDSQTAGAEPLLPCHEPGTPAPLSFSQERLWFIDQLQGSVQYHMSWLFRLNGTLNTRALETAFHAIITRHGALRTVIREEEGIGRQYVIDAGDWQMEKITAADITKNHGGTAEEYIRQLAQQPFNLSKDYMLRVTLVQISESENLLFTLFHHIAFDGWSISIIVDELITLYNQLVDGQTASLPALPVQYTDYATWQRSYLSGSRLGNKLDYWKDKLSGIVPLDLPLDHPRPAVQSTRGQSLSFMLGEDLTAKVEQWSQQHGVTVFMTLLTAFKILLYRYTGQHDIAVGTPAANRMQPAAASLIGFFVNTLVLRDMVDANAGVLHLLQQVKQTALDGYNHQDTPFEKVVEAVATERSMNNTPLFQVLFALQNTPDAKPLEFTGVTCTANPFETGTSKFDLYFDFTRTPGGLYTQVQYCTDLFEPATIRRMFDHYRQLLSAMLANPTQQIGRLQMLTSEELEHLKAFNQTQTHYPAARNIIGLFEEQAAQLPDKPALLVNGEPFTYGNLNQQANGLAHRLLTAGVRPGQKVIICMERSAGMIAAVLAILKAGAVCVPIDPRYPADRIEFMLQDAGAAAIITGSAAYETIKAPSGIPILQVSIVHPDSELSTLGNPGIYVSGILYLIYTSGSTGKPKGVLLPEKALRNLLHWQHRLDVNQPGERILQFASLNFDVSFQEIFSALCFGNTLCLVDEDQRKDMHELVGLIRREKITQLFVPYVVLKNLAEYAAESRAWPRSLRAIFTAGEQLRLTGDIQQLVQETGLRLFNQYGPSEAHVVSAYEVEAADFIQRPLPPIGKPIANTKLYITDVNGHPCGIGTIGELLIGGVQVAAGYHNQPELTAERFAPDPFSAAPGAMMYRTGDKARWLPDGNIDFLGRLDEQVKIRGYRVEPGEIESVLQQAPGIRQAVVLVRYDRQQQPVLVAWLRSEGAFDKAAVQDFLRRRLPEYMIPAVMIPIDVIPLTANGKVDKRKLPEPDIVHSAAREYVAPGNETEEKIAGIWQELLGIPRVGMNDNFFESGGHSLLVTRMNAAIRKAFGVELSVRILFQLTTPATIAAYIDLQQREVPADGADYETIQL